LAAFFLNPKSGERRRKAVGEQTKAVRERAHIAAMEGVARAKASAPRRSNAAGEALQAAVRAALDDAGAKDIDVNVRGSVVRLRGEVSDMAEIGLIGRIAAGVDGVQEVDNVIRLGG
jgi:osmotically-inducible protein OsmY